MRKIGTIYKWLAAIALISLCACNDDDKPDLSWLTNAPEKMELTSSVTDIELDREKPDDVVLTFDWTPAREMPADYVISYVTKMDIEGNEFNSSLRTEEENGIFSKSYTTAQLQQLLTEKWGQSATKTATVQFRVIAKWEGGSRYAMPEVRTVSVNVRPHRPMVFDADNVYLDGSAAGGNKITMTRTVESNYKYAFLGELKQGELNIPIEFEGLTDYICPEDGKNTWVDGDPKPMTVSFEPISWTIPKDGEYRVVVDLEKKTVAVFSPDNKLEPLVVQWPRGTITETTTVTELWLHGDINNWGAAIKGNFTQSLADPQLLVRKGTAVSGNAKFVVDGTYPNNAYAFSCFLDDPNTKQTKILNKGVWTEMGGSSSRAQRDSQFKLPSGTTLIVIDMRNNLILVN